LPSPKQSSESGRDHEGAAARAQLRDVESLSDEAERSSDGGRVGGAPAMAIVVSDSHPLYREALSAMLRAAWPDARIAVGECLTASPPFADEEAAIFIGNLGLPNNPEAAEIRRLIKLVEPAAVIWMPDQATPLNLERALAAGVRSYVSKSRDRSFIRKVISLVLDGGACFPAEVLARFSDGGELVERAKRLSLRERDVLARLAHGRSNKAIALELEMSVAMVKLHVQAILRATGAKNRTEAVIAAQRLGLVEGDI
jgi:DNA-binding NarL/FixJ family response regulator